MIDFEIPMPRTFEFRTILALVANRDMEAQDVLRRVAWQMIGAGLDRFVHGGDTTAIGRAYSVIGVAITAAVLAGRGVEDAREMFRLAYLRDSRRPAGSGLVVDLRKAA